jgi:hypothetical protein
LEPIEQSIREFLDREFPQLVLRDSSANGFGLEVVGVNEAVGSLFFQLDAEEITIFVGPTHVHFSEFRDGPERPDVAGAIAFAREVFSDRLVLWSCLGAGGAYPVASRRRHVPWPGSRHTWTGPFHP